MKKNVIVYIPHIEHGGHYGHSHGMRKLSQLPNTDDNENNSFMFRNDEVRKSIDEYLS